MRPSRQRVQSPLSVCSSVRSFVCYYSYFVIIFTHSKTNYTTNATLVCVLSYTSSAVVVLFLCKGTYISTTVAPIGVKFCTTVHIGPGQIFSTFMGGTPPKGSQRIQNFGRLKSEYLENGQLEPKISSTSVF